MIFPDGTMKEGFFENNAFIGEICPPHLREEFGIKQKNTFSNSFRSPNYNRGQ